MSKLTEQQQALLDDPFVGKNLTVHEGQSGAFVVRKRTAQLFMRIRGAKAVFGLLAAIEKLGSEDPEKVAEEMDEGSSLDLMETVLLEAMVLPECSKRGEGSVPGKKYEVRDLGDDAFGIFATIMGEDANALLQADPTPDSSQGATEES